MENIPIAGWLVDAETEYEHAIAGAGLPIRNGVTFQPLVLRSDAQVAIEAAVADIFRELDAWHRRFPQYVFRPQDDCVALRA